MASLNTKSQTKLGHESLHLPKLRTYINLVYPGENKAYIHKPLTFIQRKSLAKLRLGVLALRIETGRYEYPKLPEEQRSCLICGQDTVENEIHFLIYCPVYNEKRTELYNSVDRLDFPTMTDIRKVQYLTSDENIVKRTAQYIVDSWNIRSKIKNRLNR